ncbi:VOC family protein [Mycolicibacterium sp. GF69]|uniref:VOC family protein n=1 Tax=Mycolicibacterium sp. GF69 TaxID=2267251 RepID=UPI000DCE1E3E|nr:VOC family protein [Mycolicibacterium sp. GF69]RAV09824.1 VOC family protein [Mycolicibacterium sp. GF69]
MHAQTPVQLAWVTRDLDATEQTLTALLGAKKWVRMPDVHFAPDACTYRGEPADFVAGISLSYAGDMQLELIAPVTGRSIYTDFLDTSGPGMHHVCIEVDDVETALAERGVEAIQRGVMPGGMEFAYIEAAGVPYLEIASIPDEIRAFFDYIKQEQQ